MEKIFPAVEELIAYIDKTQDHFTLMKFSSGWKAMRGTPCLDEYGRTEVDSLIQSSDPAKAMIIGLAVDDIDFDWIMTKTHESIDNIGKIHEGL